MFATISLPHSSLLQSCCVGLQHHHNQAKVGQKGFVRSLNSLGSNLISATNRHFTYYTYFYLEVALAILKKRKKKINKTIAFLSANQQQQQEFIRYSHMSTCYYL